VDDCGERDEKKCIFRIGQRQSASGGGAYRFTGDIVAVDVYSNKHWIEHPHVEAAEDVDTSDADQVDWLDADNHDRPTDGGVVEAAGDAGGFVYTGKGSKGGLLVTANSTVGFHGQMTVAMHMIQIEGSSGYLFSKSSASGAVRSWSVYSKPEKVILYYLLDGAANHKSIVFDVDLTDERDYRIMFRIDGGLAALFVDDVRVGTQRPLNGEVLGDCGEPAANCRLVVGARSSTKSKFGVYSFQGLMMEARFFTGLALSAFPDAL
jgi:hypothetical protein